jgi:hypothetical protein
VGGVDVLEQRGEHRVLGDGGRAAEEVEEGQGEEAGGEPGGGAEGMQWLPRCHLRDSCRYKTAMVAA